MANHTSNENADSRQKKRARDRRAQQNVRDKRIAHVQALESRMRSLENELQTLRQTCQGLREENDVLRGRQRRIKSLVASWDDAAPTVPRSGLVSMSASPTIKPSPGQDDVADAAATPMETELPLPLWRTPPMHSDDDVILTDHMIQLFARRDLVSAAPDSPEPIELLYGSQTNYLANTIHDTTRVWPCRDPERLAYGWLTYHLIKWMLQPSEAAYTRLHHFQKPVPEQLRQPHPYFVDFLVWPALRASVMRNQHMYRFEDVVGMLNCCLKVRWPWNKPCLEPDTSGRLLFHPEFYSTFTSPEGWGLTEEFLVKFPVLVENLDKSTIQYDFV